MKTGRQLAVRKRSHIPWGTVHVRETLTIRATPAKLAALYLDYRNWHHLFPRTIRGVRLLKERPREITVEVDHRSEGRVVNIIRPQSPTVIALDEFKPGFYATFVNRFDASADGTRYTVDAEIRFHMPFALVAPLLRGIARRRIRRLVLEPMRVSAERAQTSRSAPQSRAAGRPKRPR